MSNAKNAIVFILCLVVLFIVFFCLNTLLPEKELIVENHQINCHYQPTFNLIELSLFTVIISVF